MEEISNLVIELSKDYNTVLYGELVQREIRMIKKRFEKTIGRKSKWNFGKRDFVKYCVQMGVVISEIISNPLNMKEIQGFKKEIECFLNSINDRGLLELLNHCRDFYLTEKDETNVDDVVNDLFHLF